MAYEITGHTVLTGLLGSPVAHSISPLMHNESFRLLGLDYVYLCFDVNEETLPAAVAGLKTCGIRGFNLTMPNKNKIVELLDELSPEAQLIGAVNTVLYDSGKVAGRDKQFVCIKANLALGGAMFVDQCDETFEKLVFAVGTFNLFSGEPPVRLFIYTQKKTLEMIPDNDIAEAVFAVQIDRLGGNHQAVNGLDAVIRKRKRGIFFQEMEERRFQMDGNLSQ